MKLVYTGPFEAVEIPTGTSDVIATSGAVVDVDDAVAGRAPKGTPGEDGYDAGEGLLAQADNFRAATPAEIRAADKAAATDAATDVTATNTAAAAAQES